MFFVLKGVIIFENSNKLKILLTLLVIVLRSLVNKPKYQAAIPINARPPSVPPMIAAGGVLAPSSPGGGAITADVEDDVVDVGIVDVDANAREELGGIITK